MEAATAVRVLECSSRWHHGPCLLLRLWSGGVHCTRVVCASCTTPIAGLCLCSASGLESRFKHVTSTLAALCCGGGLGQTVGASLEQWLQVRSPWCGLESGHVAILLSWCWRWMHQLGGLEEWARGGWRSEHLVIPLILGAPERMAQWCVHQQVSLSCGSCGYIEVALLWWLLWVLWWQRTGGGGGG